MGIVAGWCDDWFDRKAMTRRLAAATVIRAAL